MGSWEIKILAWIKKSVPKLCGIKLLKNLTVWWLEYNHFCSMFGAPIWCMTDTEVTVYRYDIWPIWISLSDYGIISKEGPVLLERIPVFLILERYFYLENCIMTQCHRGWIVHGLQKLHIWKILFSHGADETEVIRDIVSGRSRIIGV